MQGDASELSDMFHKKMTLEQPTPGSDFWVKIGKKLKVVKSLIDLFY